MTDTRIRLLSTSGISTPAPQLPDGIWLNLPEEPYFAQEGRLGSTDWCKLYLRKEGWWWLTKERKKATDYGKALHKAVLEGANAFKASVFIQPTKESQAEAYGDRFCVTVGDMTAALEKRGMNPKGMPKPELIAYCKQRAPDLIIWDNVEAEAKRGAQGKLLITTDEVWEIQLMADLVHNHPDVGALFEFGPDNLPMPEVTVLYTDEHGIQRRVRWDLLLPHNLIDLKTLTNVGNRKLEFAAGEHVAEFAYHVQMADHMAVRHGWFPRFIAAGKIYDGHPEDLVTKESEQRFAEQLAWLKRFPAEAPVSDYGWIFYQRPDRKNGAAPIVFPWGEDRGSELHRRGVRCRREAIATYRRCMEQFGPDEPWTRVEPLHTSAETAHQQGMRKVNLPHWIGGDEPQPGEDEDL